MKTVLVSDIDNVVFPFSESFMDHLSHTFGERMGELKKGKDVSYSFMHWWKKTDPVAYAFIFSHFGGKNIEDASEIKKVFLGMLHEYADCHQQEMDATPPYDGVIDAYNTIAQRQDIVAITARAKKENPEYMFRSAMQRTVDWVARYKLPFKDVLFGTKKHAVLQEYAAQNGVQVSGLVEDHPGQAVWFALHPLPFETPDFKAYLVDKPYNRSLDHEADAVLADMAFDGKTAKENWTRAVDSGRLARINSLSDILSYF